MERTFRYDFRDVLLAPVEALSIRRIVVMTFFLCLGLAVYDIFTYAALAVDGVNTHYAFSAYGLFPLRLFAFATNLATAVYAAGIALATLFLMLGFFGVGAIEIEKLRGNPFLSARESIRFAFRRLPQIFYSELAIGAFVALILLLYFVAGLVTRIPVVGEWFFALGFLFPGFFIAFFMVFVLLVFCVSLLLLPAVSAAERHGETFAAILETFSTILRQPLRWLGYTVYAVVAAKVCGFIYAYFCFRAVQFTAVGVGLGAGERATTLVRSGLSHLPAASDLVRQTFNIFPGIDWSFSVYRWTRGGTDDPAGYVMAFMLFLIFASVFGYMLAVVASAQARGFAVIRHVKDGYRISDEASLFFEDEPVNPPIPEEGNGQHA